MKGNIYLIAIICFSFIPFAYADWTVKGDLFYEDMNFGYSGFTNIRELPIREASVEVIDADSSHTLATGLTDRLGYYAIDVPDTMQRNVYLRVLTHPGGTSDLHLSIVRETPDEDLTNEIYALRSPTFRNHPSDVDLNLSLLAKADTDIGKAFNLYDTAIMGIDFIAHIDGSRPPDNKWLRIGWAMDSGHSGSYFRSSEQGIHMGDEAAYDDTIILHEFGHYAHYYLSRSDSPGGSHTISDWHQDVRLSFSEGFATFYACSVRAFHGAGRSDIYVNTNDYTDLSFVYEMEDLARYRSTKGAASEGRVTAALWDLVDGPETRDSSLGTDDDSLTVDHLEWLEIFKGPLLSDPDTISMEDFWEAWFSPTIDNGYVTEMEEIFFQQHRMEFFRDHLEDNDQSNIATMIALDEDNTLTYYASGDDDYLSFHADVGRAYIIQTNHLFSGADTVVRLYDMNKAIELAYNDDKLNGYNLIPVLERYASELLWLAPFSGEFLLRTYQHPYAVSTAEWGSYTLRVEPSRDLPIVWHVLPRVLTPNRIQKVFIEGEYFADQAGITFTSPYIKPLLVNVPHRKLMEVYVEVGDTTQDLSDFTITNNDGNEFTASAALIIDDRTPPPVLLSEIDVGGVDAVEIYNRSESAVQLLDWQLSAYRFGYTTRHYAFPDVTLEAGAYLVISEVDGTDTNTTLYIGQNISWSDGVDGACTLIDADGFGVDMAQWGSSAITFPPNTDWRWNIEAPRYGVNLGRNSLQFDSDSGSDWSEQYGSMGDRNRADSVSRLQFITDGIPSIEVYLEASLQIRIQEHDENSLAQFAETVRITITNLSNGDYESTNLREMGTDSGLFQSNSSIFLTETAEVPSPDFVLAAKAGDVLIATYTDGNDPSDEAIVWALVRPARAQPETKIRMGGYWTTALQHGSAGTMTLMALSDAGAEFKVLYEGQATGLKLTDDGLNGDQQAGDGISSLVMDPFPAIGNPMEVLLELEDVSDVIQWPYLLIED